MFYLENAYLRVAISTKGAELQSLFDKRHNKEWLWQGDPVWWGKRAPFLFPFVGALKGGTYNYAGQSYTMSKHGFARDMVFKGEQVSDSSLRFTLAATPETKAVYPFEFELAILYTLEAQSLTVGFEVKNQGTQPMIFSLGGHPAFNCPMDTETWSLHFEKPELLESYCIDLKQGLILPDKKRVSGSGQPLLLNSGLFAEDALVFEHLNSKSVTLKGPEVWEQLRFEMEGFPLFALWSPQGPFLCLEPWVGMADFVGTNGILEEKYGVQTLAARDVYSCFYKMVL